MTVRLWVTLVLLTASTAPLTAAAPPPPWQPRQRSEASILESLADEATLLDLEEDGVRKRLKDNSEREVERINLASFHYRRYQPDWGKGLALILSDYNHFSGLPIVTGKRQFISQAKARIIDKTAFELRRYHSSREAAEKKGIFVERKAVAKLIGVLTAQQTLTPRPRALEQVMQKEAAPLRAALIRILRHDMSDQGTEALARRAVYEPSAELRRLAVEILRQRKTLAAARPVFLEALRHPWAPAAEHAALALVELKDIRAIGGIKRLLAQPDPALPRKMAPTSTSPAPYFHRELVAVNHLRNCVLCHPQVPADRTVSGFLGAIPNPKMPLPDSYDDGESLGTVAFDIVLLRPDFSVVHEVDKHFAGKWPRVQRFDYLVRERELTKDEATEILANATVPSIQRRSMLWALQQLRREQNNRLTVLAR